MDREPSISQAEVEYLLEVVQWAFPEQELETTDILSTFSGVRPVIDTGKPNPSQESREHVLWNEAGLLTVTGGKLTTFRLMAIDALRATQAGLSKRLPRLHIPDPSQSVLDPSLEEISFPSELKPKDRLRLMGRYGAEVVQLIATASESDWLKIPGSPYTMAELRWAARAEGVLHLDDLLLRRTRLGLLLPEGGRLLLSSLRPIIQAETGWDDRRWDAEKRRYAQIWHSFYSLTG
jgi:glycerol-3-phosphate dehydrogenase